MTKFHLFFNDGYDEIVGPSPEAPFIAYTDRYQELIAKHGQPYDYKVIEEEEDGQENVSANDCGTPAIR